MKKAYILLARKLIEASLKKLAFKYSFLGGFVGKLIAIIFAPILAYMIEEGHMIIEFERIAKSVEMDINEYKEVFKELGELNEGNKEITEAEKERLLLKVKQITRKALSIKQYLR